MAEAEAAPTTEPTETEATDEAATKRPLSLLATELFGSNYHGEAEPQAEPEVQTEETAEVVESEPESQPQEEGDNEAPISSVSELVQHFELDPEWFEGLKVHGKVDGKPVEYTIKDLRDRAQMYEAAEHRLEEAKSKAKTLNQELAEKSEALKGQFATAAKLIENAEQLLEQDEKAIDWKKLRDDDPAEWSAKQAEMNKRRSSIDKMKADARESWKQSVESQQREMQEKMHQHLQSEHSALLEKLPEWQDAEKAKAEKAKVSDYLMGSMGFSREDVMGASDHRLILMARKAMLYDELQADTNVARKKLAKVPKVMKPGAPKPQEQVNRERVDKLKSKLRKSGSLDDAYALLKARRGGQ